MTAPSTTHSAPEPTSLFQGFCRGQARLTEIFSQATHIGAAIEPSLAAIGSSLGWSCVQLWAQQRDRTLSLLESWSPLGADSLAFQRASWDSTFAPGDGAPGRALEAEHPVWIADIDSDAHLPRARAAVEDGLGALLEVPLAIRANDEPPVFHIMEFAAASPARTDPQLLEMTHTLCEQMTQFATMRLYAHLVEQGGPIAIREEIVEPLEIAYTALETGNVDHASTLVHHAILAAKRLAGRE